MPEFRRFFRDASKQRNLVGFSEGPPRSERKIVEPPPFVLPEAVSPPGIVFQYLWDLDATKVTTSDGNKIDELRDLFGDPGSILQPVSSPIRPTYFATGGPNNMPYMRFQNINEALTSTVSWSNPALQKFTLLALARMTNPQPGFEFGLATEGATKFVTVTLGEANELQGTNAPDTTIPLPPPDNEWFYIELGIDTTTNTMLLRSGNQAFNFYRATVQYSTPIVFSDIFNLIGNTSSASITDIAVFMIVSHIPNFDDTETQYDRYRRGLDIYLNAVWGVKFSSI